MRILRIRSRGLKAPRSIVTNGVALLLLFIGAVVLAYLLLFRDEPGVLPPEFDLKSALRDVDTLSQYFVELSLPIAVHEQSGRFDIRELAELDDRNERVRFFTDLIDSSNAMIVQIGAVAVYGPSFDIESIRVSDDLLELATPAASLRDVRRIPSRDRIVQPGMFQIRGDGAAYIAAAADRGLIDARHLAERDTEALKLTSERARRALEVVARRSGLRVVFKEAK